MKKPRMFTRALIAIAMTAISTGAWATSPKECSLIGTWAGQEENDMYWLGVHTASTTPTKGDMLLDWVFVNPNLLNGAARLTPGRGVWEQFGHGRQVKYKYTWYAYGLDANGEPVYTVRVSGLAANTDCDNVEITYTYEIFEPVWPPEAVADLPSVYTTSGQASEKRVRVAVTP